MSKWETVREIGIDAGHRVPEHGSKCRNLHGHRYRIQAYVQGDLHTAGEQDGMTLDFGFLKQVLLEHIDAPCDHGLILSVHDPFLFELAGVAEEEVQEVWDDLEFQPYNDPLWLSSLPWYQCQGRLCGKVYVVPFTPTAENLAMHWYMRMFGPVKQLTDGRAWLHRVTVWETPNCNATFPV